MVVKFCFNKAICWRRLWRLQENCSNYGTEGTAAYSGKEKVAPCSLCSTLLHFWSYIGLPIFLEVRSKAQQLFIFPDGKNVANNRYYNDQIERTLVALRRTLVEGQNGNLNEKKAFAYTKVGFMVFLARRRGQNVVQCFKKSICLM